MLRDSHWMWPGFGKTACCIYVAVAIKLDLNQRTSSNTPLVIPSLKDFERHGWASGCAVLQEHLFRGVGLSKWCHIEFHINGPIKLRKMWRRMSQDKPELSSGGLKQRILNYTCIRKQSVPSSVQKNLTNQFLLCHYGSLSGLHVKQYTWFISSNVIIHASLLIRHYRIESVIYNTSKRWKSENLRLLKKARHAQGHLCTTTRTQTGREMYWNCGALYKTGLVIYWQLRNSLNLDSDHL